MPLSALLLSVTFPLWPGPPPGSETWTWPEATIQFNNEPRLANVTHPELYEFLPKTPPTAAVIICPGGAFVRLAMEPEGFGVARFLNSIGVAAFVLKYRLVRTGDGGANDPAVMAARRKKVIPLAVADGLQALRVVRARAAEWRIPRDRIGILGFSAGGYIAVSAALHHAPSTRPDFLVAIYPVLPNEDVAPPPDAPPLFVLQAEDDNAVPVLSSSLKLYAAWQKAKVPAEIHIYAKGGHGFGIRSTNPFPLVAWPDRLRDWLKAQGLLQP